MHERILFLDDSPEWSQRLRDRGGDRFEVVEASDPQAVLPQLCSRAFHAIVCDPARSDGQGLEILRRLKMAAPATPLILLTAQRDADLLSDCVAIGEPFRVSFKQNVSSVRLRELVEEAVTRDWRDREARELEQELAHAHDSLRELTAGLEERLTDQVQGLRILHRFALDLNSTESLESIARLAAQATFDLLGGRGVHVQIWDDEENQRVVRADVGPEMSSRMHREPLRTSQGQVGEIVVDMGVEGPEIEALVLENLTLVSGPTAVAVTNVLRARERDQAQQATILALARLSEERDNETGKHIERVSRYCELVARGLRDRGFYLEQISDRFIDHLVRSAPLHDIGKVGIPDSILLKPGKLSPGEWEIMKTHASIGESTLDAVIRSTRNPGYLQMGRDIAGGHHERWDGTGYPRGLSQEDIPLSARILALADIYDALTTRRPYKDSWSHARAMEHIAGLSGNHLDPHVVTVFLELGEQADRIRDELSDDEVVLPLAIGV